MIAYVYGTVEALTEDSAVLDVNGIGYEIKITARTGELLSGMADKVKLHTYMQVKEDDVQLFGFLTRDDLAVFRLLISVNGIGPKGALGILSALSADDLRMAVATGDVKAITRAPGVGARTAQRLILDLKDKLKLTDVFEHFGDTGESFSALPADGPAAAKTEAIEALTALGYSNADAVQAVKRAMADSADADMDTEAILKSALKQMARF